MMKQHSVIKRVFLFLIEAIRLSWCSQCIDDTCFHFSVKHENIRDDHVLVGYVIRNVTLPPGENCMTYCAFDCLCLSFNVQKNGKECQLNFESHNEKASALQKLKGYQYALLNVKQGKCPDSQCGFCCSERPCKNQGTCEELCPANGKRFLCHCRLGYQGSLCQIETCNSNPCKNNGICKPNYSSEGYHCQCTAGFTGKNCEEVLSPCEPNPCQWGGTCVPGNNNTGYNCTCTERCIGTNCAECVDRCASNPCMHNGTCDNHNESMCQCTPQYKGNLCENKIDD